VIKVAQGISLTVYPAADWFSERITAKCPCFLPVIAVIGKGREG